VANPKKWRQLGVTYHELAGRFHGLEGTWTIADEKRRLTRLQNNGGLNGGPDLPHYRAYEDNCITAGRCIFDAAGEEGVKLKEHYAKLDRRQPILSAINALLSKEERLSVSKFEEDMKALDDSLGRSP
jgi:hypothetical protein